MSQQQQSNLRIISLYPQPDRPSHINKSYRPMFYFMLAMLVAAPFILWLIAFLINSGY